MNPRLRSVLAVIAAMIIGGAAVAIIELLNVLLFPHDPSLDPYNEADMKVILENLPTWGYIIVIFAHTVGAFVAGWMAALINKRQRHTSIICGVLFLFAGIYNFIVLPNFPAFMWIDLIVYIPAAWLGWRITKRSID